MAVFDCFVSVNNSELHHDVNMAGHEDGEQTPGSAHLLLQLLHRSLQPDLQSARASDEEMSSQHGKENNKARPVQSGLWAVAVINYDDQPSATQKHSKT